VTRTTNQASAVLRMCHDSIEGMNLPKENKVLRIGDKGPDFTLTDASTGETVGLSDILGQPLVIIFGRGTW
jgi:hypothetical protein